MGHRSWEGKVVIVTGGAQGVGSATCQHFARLGADVVSTDVQTREADAQLSTLKSLGARALFVAADIRSEADVQMMADKTMETFGRIDLLVNNAAILHNHDRPEDFTLGEIRQIVDVDLVGPLLATHIIAPKIEETGGGNIINISSTGAIMEIPTSPAYAAAKAGILAFTRSLAAAFVNRNIRVNALLPSLIDTPMTAGSSLHQSKAAMKPDDIAQAIAYVAGKMDVQGAFFAVRHTAGGVRLFRVLDPPEEKQLEIDFISGQPELPPIMLRTN